MVKLAKKEPKIPPKPKNRYDLLKEKIDAETGVYKNLKELLDDLKSD